jgi:hypothetical protein
MGEPTQTDDGPLIVPALAPGLIFIVNVAFPDPITQVFDTWYVITTLPGATPVTIPVTGSTVAIEVLPLLHVPPALPVVFNKVEVPAQMVDNPEIIPGLPPGFTVRVK